MTRPYITRLLLAPPFAPADTIELVRFSRGLTNYDRRTWLRDISPDWRVTEEHAREIPEFKRTKP